MISYFRTGLGTGVAALLVALGLSAHAQDPRTVRPIPPDAQLIFASDRDHELDPWGLPANELYAATLDGKVTRITHSRLSDNHFDVSPNRRYIAVNRFSRGPASPDSAANSLGQPNASAYFPLKDWKELWIVDTLTGRERRLLPHVDAGYGGVAWSPDSKWVYFATPSVTRTTDIVRVNIDTERVEVISKNLLKLLGLNGADQRKWVSDVDLSDDGSRLAFMFGGPDVNAGKGKPRIVAMRVDGTEAHFVSSGGPLSPGMRGVWPIGDFDPEISPDGAQVVFERMTDKGFVTPALSTFDIVIVDADGTHERDISPPGGVAAEFIPSWGWNDDGKIVFTRLDPHAGMGPVIYDPRTNMRTMIPVGGSATHVQWIPSGRVQCRHVVCSPQETRAMNRIWRSREAR